MGGDISRNPGPIKQSPNRNKTEDTNRVNGRANRSCKTQKQKCLSCEKTIRCNQKQISCFVCFSLYHIKCVGVATDWSCSNCLMSHLPYFKCSIEEILDNDYGHQPLSPQPNPPRVLDPSDIATTLQNRPSNLRVMHLNTQSMVSTFNEFLLTVNNYALDIITLSKTWLKDNPLLMEYVTISGFNTEFRSRNTIRDGGVGSYIKDTIKYKRRRDIENLLPELVHLWREVPGRNKHSKALVRVIYRSRRILDDASWFDETLLAHLTVT